MGKKVAEGRNPWVKSYKIALTYSSSESDYVKELDATLIDIFGRDDVYFYEAKEYQIRLDSVNLIDALDTIYRDSTILVAVFGKDYDNSKWCGLEYKHIKERLLNNQRNTIFLIIADDTKLPDFLEYEQYIEKSQFGIERIAQELKSRYERAICCNQEKDSCSTRFAGEIISDERLKQFCFALGRDRENGEEGDCIVHVTGEAMYYTNMAHKKTVELLYVIKDLMKIKRFLCQAEFTKTILSNNYINDRCNDLREYCFNLLGKFEKKDEEVGINENKVIQLRIQHLAHFLNSFIYLDKSINPLFCECIANYLFLSEPEKVEESIVNEIKALCYYSSRVCSNLLRSKPVFSEEIVSVLTNTQLYNPNIDIVEIPTSIKNNTKVKRKIFNV